MRPQNNPWLHLLRSGNLGSQQGRGNTGWKGHCSDGRGESARYLLGKEIGIFARTAGKAPSLIKGTWCVLTYQAPPGMKAFLFMLYA